MKQILRDKLKDYFRKEKEVIAVYLFGSYVMGRDRPGSDLDVGILMTNMDEHGFMETRNRYIVELSRLLRKDVHIAFLNSAGEALQRQIFQKGECVLVNDTGAHARSRMVMYSQIADFAYYEKKIQAAVAKKVLEG